MHSCRAIIPSDWAMFDTLHLEVVLTRALSQPHTDCTSAKSHNIQQYMANSGYSLAYYL